MIDRSRGKARARQTGGLRETKNGASSCSYGVFTPAFEVTSKVTLDR